MHGLEFLYTVLDCAVEFLEFIRKSLDSVDRLSSVQNIDMSRSGACDFLNVDGVFKPANDTFPRGHLALELRNVQCDVSLQDSIVRVATAEVVEKFVA